MNHPDDIELVGDGITYDGIKGAESFTLTFTGLSTTDTLTYYCTAHPNTMQGTFDLQESASS